jgi:hypothetical protein
MSTATAMKPTENEYAPYYGKYIALVTEENVIEALENSLRDTLELLNGITEEKADYRYAPEKWSIKEVIGHIGDSERVFAYRALCFSRNYDNNIAGFDENEFIANSNFRNLSLKDVVDEFVAIRNSTIVLFKNMSEEAWTRKGIANDNEISVRALANILVGHERHHVGVIRTRYLTE